MPNTKAQRKLERRLAEFESEKRIATTTPRHIHDEWWCFPGSGERLLQLVCRPSFEPTVCYEIYREDVLRLYRSISAEPEDDFVLGFSRVMIDPEIVETLMGSIDGLLVPIRTQRIPAEICDGVRYEVAAFVGQTRSRLSWHGAIVPSEWNALANLVESSIRDFDALAAVAET